LTLNAGIVRVALGFCARCRTDPETPVDDPPVCSAAVLAHGGEQGFHQGVGWFGSHVARRWLGHVPEADDHAATVLVDAEEQVDWRRTESAPGEGRTVHFSAGSPSRSVCEARAPLGNERKPAVFCRPRCRIRAEPVAQSWPNRQDEVSRRCAGFRAEIRQTSRKVDTVPIGTRGARRADLPGSRADGAYQDIYIANVGQTAENVRPSRKGGGEASPKYQPGRVPGFLRVAKLARTLG